MLTMLTNLIMGAVATTGALLLAWLPVALWWVAKAAALAAFVLVVIRWDTGFAEHRRQKVAINQRRAAAGEPLWLATPFEETWVLLAALAEWAFLLGMALSGLLTVVLLVLTAVAAFRLQPWPALLFVAGAFVSSQLARVCYHVGDMVFIPRRSRAS